MNRMLVRLFPILLIAAGSCSAPKPSGDLIVAASFYPVYIEALNVAGNVPGVRVVNLAPPQTGCLHDYQLTPQDLKTLAAAEILVINGGGMEPFIDKATRQLPRRGGLQVINASQGIRFLQAGGGNSENGHVWLSLSNAQRQVRNIARRLSELDPTHAPQYRRNADGYLAKLDMLKAKIHRELKGITRRDIVTFHEAFPYFAKEFGLNVVAVIELEPGAEPSAGELVAIVSLVRETGVKVLFAEPQYPAKSARAIARETGATVSLLDPAVDGPADPDAYIRIMEQNLETLKQALK
ncbi:MAG: metal ABC transporter substrate-binding protein [Candidatus Edwardsbacteria bacterium]|nr:metal ABC transporter substrate-binding protein [Candidatus Edwardsbacteria bacterium]